MAAQAAIRQVHARAVPVQSVVAPMRACTANRRPAVKRWRQLERVDRPGAFLEVPAGREPSHPSRQKGGTSEKAADPAESAAFSSQNTLRAVKPCHDGLA